MERRAKFVYGLSGSETTLELTISQAAWLPADSTVGGSRTSAAGIPASYVVRRDRLLDVTLRLWESEWGALLNLIEWGQGAEAFLFYPDAEEATSWQVYLEAPEAGSRFAPSRDGTYPRIFTAALTLRGLGIEIPWQPYFEG
jgi:hypothetical protein